MTAPRRFLPSIASLRAFEALDRLGSATAAAEELDLSQSAVSRQLQTLEEQLGIALIHRQGRGMVLTPVAKEYATTIRRALQQIAQASLKVTINPSGGSLDLAILPTFGIRWLVPRLSEFARLHPEVTINLSTRIKQFNFDREPFDAAIHFGEKDWPDAGFLRLKTERVVAVCVPDLLINRRITTANDVAQLPLLHIETRPEAWRQWFAAQGVQTTGIAGTIYDQFSTITQAALHGLGVALLPDYLAEQDLATGRLVLAWGQAIESQGAYFLVWPKEKSDKSALSKFRDWLAEQAEDEDPLPR